jgi:hypothetical protein
MANSITVERAIFCGFFTHVLLPISLMIVMCKTHESQHATDGYPMGFMAACFQVFDTPQREAREARWRAHRMV